FTPAIQFSDEKAEENHFLAILTPDASARATWSIVAVDPATGEARYAGPLPQGDLAPALADLPVRHLLFYESERSLVESLPGMAQLLKETIPEHYIVHETAVELLQRTYGIHTSETLVSTPAQVTGLAALIQYILRSQNVEQLNHLK